MLVSTLATAALLCFPDSTGSSCCAELQLLVATKTDTRIIVILIFVATEMFLLIVLDAVYIPPGDPQNVVR
jgi:hypothetical protein